MDAEEAQLLVFKKDWGKGSDEGQPPFVYVILDALALHLRNPDKHQLGPTARSFLVNALENVVRTQGSLDEEVGLAKTRGRPKNPLIVDIRITRRVIQLIKEGNTVLDACEKVGQEVYLSPEAVLKLFYRLRNLTDKVS